MDLRKVASLHECIDALLVIAAALPDDLRVLSAGAARFDPGTHGAVERPGAEAAANHEQVLLAFREAIVCQAFGAVLRRVGMDHRADGVAAEDDLVGREEFLHPVVGDADAADALPEDLVGQSGEAVLLLDQGGDVLARGLPEQGRAGIASHADGDVGAEVVEDAAGPAQAFRHLEGDAQIALDVRPVELALQSGDGEPFDLVACRGDFLHLHLAFGSDEEDFRLRIDFLELAGDRDGREDVAARAAATDDDA